MRWCGVDVLAPVETCQVCGSGRRVTEYGEHAERLYSIGPIACMRWNVCCQENNHGINRVVALADACKYRFTRQGRTTAPATLSSGRRSAPRVSHGLRSPSCSLPGGRLRNPGVWICGTDWLSSSSGCSPRGSTPWPVAMLPFGCRSCLGRPSVTRCVKRKI
ncbi:hypothetical protein BGZ61DRAFT_455132 [Ilyonectria robusta]|uniref:uncharacterized protein n=1 Tax=Ilyonectria robusta TaxID=1079257 RepID=UPI001E8CE79D|nr:uncharacterized protein BGZ61DRAFT_455132 [Ilyonectria robusta]KAH8685226.1 hypothetical protein BGZ61DRAFT_455132 [Ilyonectria robusta]